MRFLVFAVFGNLCWLCCIYVPWMRSIVGDGPMEASKLFFVFFLSFALVLTSLVFSIQNKAIWLIVGTGAVSMLHLLALGILIFGK
jgi:hypothetical protein